MIHRPLVGVAALVAVGTLLVAALPAASADANERATTRAHASGRAHPKDEPDLAEVARARAVAASQRSGSTAAALSTRVASASARLASHSSLVRPAAAAAMTDCSGLYGAPFLCGSVKVRTSATDPSLGTRTIDFVYRPADVQPATAVSLFSDGPTQSTFSELSPWKAEFYAEMATGQGADFATRDVLLVNTRGTGADAVECPMLQSVGSPLTEAVEECVRILGRSIDYFTTGDAADDLDAVRAFVLGRTAKVDLVTMGHATALGQAYLARYSRRVHTAILDEAVNPNAWGNVEITDSTTIAGRVCRRSARCSAQIDDAVSEIAWLAAKVRQSPVTGMTTLADGTPQHIVLGEPELAWGLVAPESGTYAYGAGLAAAIRAYRLGDSQPLLRLAANAGIGEGWSVSDLTDVGDDVSEWSVASFATANCNEWPTAYDLTADQATRRQQAQQRLAAQSPALYGIFSHSLFDLAAWPECWAWPGPQRVNTINPSGGRYADVPILVMAGDLDTDHPPTAARTVAARYPNATYVTIPRSGQPSLFWSTCAARIAQHFMDTATTGDTRCASTDGKTVLGIGDFPRFTAQESPARSASKADRSTARDRRVAAVAVYTALDSVLQSLDAGGGESGPALRGGSFATVFGDEGATITLHDARFTQDVIVNGDVDVTFVEGRDNAPAHLTVAGPGTADGMLVVDAPAFFSLDHPTAHVTGQIGGRSLDLTVDIH